MIEGRRRREARRGEARRGEERRGEERTPESTDSTDYNEVENKNKAVRQLNDRTHARTHSRTLRPDRTESWPTSFLDVPGNRHGGVNRDGDLGFFVRCPREGSSYFMLYPTPVTPSSLSFSFSFSFSSPPRVSCSGSALN